MTKIKVKTKVKQYECTKCHHLIKPDESPDDGPEMIIIPAICPLCKNDVFDLHMDQYILINQTLDSIPITISRDGCK